MKEESSSPDFNKFMDGLIHQIREKSKDNIRCKDCKWCEVHEVFGICRNPNAHFMSESVFNTPVRLTTTCERGEK